MIAYFFTFNKKTLSTKVPVNEIGSGINCDITLLDNTSILTPSIRLKLATSPAGYNYAWIPEFNRYYRVKNWSSFRDMWTCDLECDLLASYATTILNSSQYVMRSASDYDITLLDTIYPTKCEISEEIDQANDEFFFSGLGYASNSFMATVQTLGDSSGTVTMPSQGGTNFYKVTVPQLQAILSYMTVNFSNFLTSTDLSLETAKMIFNPFEYITSIKIWPFVDIGKTTDTGVTLENIKFGFWTMTGNDTMGYRTSAPYYTKDIYIPIHQHPQVSTKGNKMNSNTYTKRVVHINPFGDIALNCDQLLDAIGIRFHLVCDLLTGNAKCVGKPVRLANEVSSIPFIDIPYAPCFEAIQNIAYEVPILTAQPNLSVGSIFPAAASAAAAIGVKGGEAIGNQFAKAAGFINFDEGLRSTGMEGYARSYGIGDAVSASLSEAQHTGSSGSRLHCSPDTYTLTPFISSIFYSQVDENITDHGRPLCQRKLLSSLSGFCVCEGAELPISGTTTEQSAIESIMNSGFYIE